MERAGRRTGRSKKNLTEDELFAFRLCLAIGGPDAIHPDFLLRRLTYRQFRDWMAYAAVEPFGEVRADQRTAAQTLWMIAPYCKSKINLPNLMHPYFDGQSPEEIAAAAKTLDERIQELKNNGHFDCQTRDPADGGHNRTVDGDEPRATDRQ